MATTTREHEPIIEIRAPTAPEHVLWFDDERALDIAQVGGKNASLGVLIQRLSPAGVRVPTGFAVVVNAWNEFMRANGLRDRIGRWLGAEPRTQATTRGAGARIRGAILDAEIPEPVAAAITDAYAALCIAAGSNDIDVAVRSSATTEDLPAASFAGQQDTYLNVNGAGAVLDACRRCYASRFTDRAIAYREEQGIDHLAAAMSIGVQRMVQADVGSAGVMFTVDTETGFPGAVIINGSWGLGEAVVQGAVDPDEWQVFKPLLDSHGRVPIINRRRGAKETKVTCRRGASGTEVAYTSDAERSGWSLSDDDVLRLARWGCVIEAHFGRPMDIEWVRDGVTGELYIVQARPETVEARRDARTLRTFELVSAGRRLASGCAVGQAIASGPVCRLETPGQIDRFVDGAVLVTTMTDPDWVPIMRRAAAIVTDHGGRTSHAAIVSRELGVPAIVGTGNATSVLANGAVVTACCAEGDEGHVYEGEAEVRVDECDLDALPKVRTRVTLNLGDPGAAMRWWRLPSQGVGLARMEFIISNFIKVHPLALARFSSMTDPGVRARIAELTVGYHDPAEFFVDTLARGIARIAAVHWPHQVIVRMSDFKTNEYAELIGGRQFEPTEENPMLGWRGASRYYSDDYRDGFALECRAVARARDVLGLQNIVVMIPFCRTLDEADRVLDELAANGLRRGASGLRVWMMCEVPSNVILASEFARRFDGFSIGSNDLTQLALGVDRDAARLAELFHEDDPAVTALIEQAIECAHLAGRPIGICGQAPSDHPEFAEFLVRCGIDSVSVTPDSFARVVRHIARAEGIANIASLAAHDDSAAHAASSGAPSASAPRQNCMIMPAVRSA